VRERQQYVELLLESRAVDCEEDGYREPPIALQQNKRFVVLQESRLLK
jgi:hypothetical protein